MPTREPGAAVGTGPEAFRAPVRLHGLWEAMGRPCAWLAGGSVRDRLLGRPSGDLDIAVAGNVESVAGIARRAARVLGAHAHLLGRPPHSVWRIVANDVEIELWPLDGLSPEDDARRRDFTCNALLWNLPSGPLVDPTEGASDIAARVLRAVSRSGLSDDPIRLLRAARFLADLKDFQLEEETSAWVRELAPTLAAAPRERVGRELAALLDADRPDRGVAALIRLGLLDPAAPPGCTTEPGWLSARLAAIRALTERGEHPVAGAVAVAGPAARRGILLRGLGAAQDDLAACFAWDRSVRSAAVRAGANLERLIATSDGSAADRRELIAMLGESFPAALAAAAAADAATGWRSGPWRRWWRLWHRHGSYLATVAGRGRGPGPDRWSPERPRARPPVASPRAVPGPWRGPLKKRRAALRTGRRAGI